MRANPHFAAGVAGSVVIALLTATVGRSMTGAAGAADARRPVEVASAPAPAFSQAQPTDESTPVVDPDPPPVPRHIPIGLARHDFHAPEPLPATARGYLVPLLAAGRVNCAPATHALMLRDDGGSGEVVAVAYPLRPDDPTTALDLYAGSLVELSGTEAIPPSGCVITTRLIGVDKVTILDTPGRPTEPPPLPR